MTKPEEISERADVRAMRGAPYVDFSWRLTAPQPILCKGAVLYLFEVTADLTELQTLCDNVFDKPSGGQVKCQAIDKTIFLLFGNIDWVGLPATIPGVHEQQVLVHIPVRYYSKSGSDLAYFTPFLGVDNALSMAGGREVFGYPKTMGCLDVPRTLPNPLNLLFRTWRGNATDTYWTVEDQITLCQGAPNPAASVIDAFIEALNRDTGSRELFTKWLAGASKEIFFRQFRAFNSTTIDQLSCFQEIAVATYSALPHSKGPIGFEFDVEMADFYSGPIVTRSGLRPTMSGVYGKTDTYHGAAKNAIWTALQEFTLSSPQILWTNC